VVVSTFNYISHTNVSRLCFHQHSAPRRLLGAHSGGFWAAACFTLVSCLTYSSTLKMVATFSAQTSINLQWRYTAKYEILLFTIIQVKK
jgi:hypothetical protein